MSPFYRECVKKFPRYPHHWWSLLCSCLAVKPQTCWLLAFIHSLCCFVVVVKPMTVWFWYNFEHHWTFIDDVHARLPVPLIMILCKLMHHCSGKKRSFGYLMWLNPSRDLVYFCYFARFVINLTLTPCALDHINFITFVEQSSLWLLLKSLRVQKVHNVIIYLD